MSNRRLRPAGRALIALALLAAVTGGIAEVSNTGHTNLHTDTLVMDIVQTITDGADPIPQIQVAWTSYRNTNEGSTLNPTGEIRPDGRPAIAVQTSALASPTH